MSSTPAPATPAPLASASNRAARRPRRRALLAVVPALGIAAGALTGPVAAGAADPTCATDCVNTVNVARRLAGARISFTTTTMAKVKLELYHLGGSHVTTFTEPSARLAHEFDTGSILKPGVLYEYRITATDTKGKVRKENGTFQGASQTVKVTIDKVVISDDSDNGAGEIAAGARLGTATTTLWNEASITSPATRNPAKSLTVSNAGSAVWLDVQLVDDDVDFWELDPYGSGFSWSVIENQYRDANNARIDLALATTPGVHTRTFSMSAPNQRLDFSVQGTIVVTVS